MAVHEAESRRTGGHGRQTEQSSRRGHCGARPHLADVVDRAVPSELLCICWPRHAAAEVPDFDIRARTVCNAGDPVVASQASQMATSWALELEFVTESRPPTELLALHFSLRPGKASPLERASEQWVFAVLIRPSYDLACSVVVAYVRKHKEL